MIACGFLVWGRGYVRKWLGAVSPGVHCACWAMALGSPREAHWRQWVSQRTAPVEHPLTG